MIQIENLALFLNDRLNEIAKKKKTNYQFKIFPEVGHGSKELGVVQIEGNISRQVINNPPLIGIVINDSKYVLDLIVPTPSGANKYVVDIYSIFDDLTQEINGKVFELGGGESKFVVDGASVQSEVKNSSTVGQSVIMRIGFSVQYSENITMINHYKVELKLPGIIDKYFIINPTNIGTLLNFVSTPLNNIANIDDGLDYNQNFTRTFSLTFYAQRNDYIDTLVNTYLMSKSNASSGTNNLVFIKLTRHETSAEFKVKIASMQTNIPNNLGYETITLTLTKYSLDDLEEDDVE